MRIVSLAFMLAVAALATAAQAAGPAPLNCDSPMTQMEMTHCASRDFYAADTELNAAYRALGKMLDAHGRDLLTISKRKWIEWRNAECTFRTYGSEDGSAHRMVVSICLTELTKARTTQLKKLSSCSVDDMTCPAK